MTLPTFVATASGGDTTSGTSFSLTRDSAATLNRVRVFLLYRETNSAITASGWSSIGQAVNSGSPNLYGDFLWHRDNGSDPASWTISWTGSSWFGWVICSWDSVVTSGTPVEAFASGSGNSNTFTGPTITTLGTDRLRIFGNVFFYSSASSFGNPSVGTRRGNIGALAQLTDEQRASAGATGTITIQANNTETGRWAAGCFGLIGVSAAAPQTITLSTVSLAGSVPTGDAVPGAVSILGSTPTLIGSVPVMSVISGTANVLLSALALASSPQASSVASGGVSVASNTLGLAGSVPASGITPGATTVLLNRYGSLRFYGNGTGNIDRARIPLDTGSVSTAADVGAGNFTYECWLKCLYADNTSSSIGDARNSNIFFDRDIWGHERGWVAGVTRVAGPKLVACFGLAGAGLTWNTIIGTTSIGDGNWHHVAIVRNQSTGLIELYVDGNLDASDTYTTGDLSYPDGYDPGSGQNNPYLVLGAEKHDAGGSYPSYNGSMTELRISDSRRYTAAFVPVPAPFADDGNTAGLYHFGDMTGTTLSDSASAGPTNGELLVGGSPEGPAWVYSQPSIAMNVLSGSVPDASVTSAAAVLLNALSLAGTAQTSAVAPGGVSALLSALTLAGSAQASSVSGAAAVLLNAIALVSSAPTSSVAPGAISTLMSALALASSVPASSVASGAIYALLTTLSLASSAESSSVSPGAVAPSMTSLSLASTVPSAAVSPGAVAALLSSVSLAASAPSLTVSIGAAAVMLAALSLASSAESASVSPGAVSTLLDVLTLASSAEAFSLAAETSIGVNTLSLAGSVPGAAVVPGAAAVSLNDIALIASVVSLLVDAGQLHVAARLTLSEALANMAASSISGVADVTTSEGVD